MADSGREVNQRRIRLPGVHIIALSGTPRSQSLFWKSDRAKFVAGVYFKW